MTSAEVTQVDTKGAGCKVTVKTKEGEEKIDCDVVLSAVGVVSQCGKLWPGRCGHTGR